MNKEIKISTSAADDDEGVGADPSTFNPDDILTNNVAIEDTLIDTSKPLSEG